MAKGIYTKFSVGDKVYFELENEVCNIIQIHITIGEFKHVFTKYRLRSIKGYEYVADEYELKKM